MWARRSLKALIDMHVNLKEKTLSQGGICSSRPLKEILTVYYRDDDTHAWGNINTLITHGDTVHYTDGDTHRVIVTLIYTW